MNCIVSHFYPFLLKFTLKAIKISNYPISGFFITHFLIFFNNETAFAVDSCKFFLFQLSSKLKKLSCWQQKFSTIS